MWSRGQRARPAESGTEQQQGGGGSGAHAAGAVVGEPS